jgi:WD40 repeat protein
VWDARTGRPLAPAWQDPGGGGAWFAGLSPDGKLLALVDTNVFRNNAGLEQKQTLLRLWDLAAHQPVGTPQPLKGVVYSVLTFSPDGRTLYVQEGHRVLAWDTAACQPLGKSFPLDADQVVRGLALSPDGRTLACLAPDNKVWLWDVTTGRLRQEPLAQSFGVGIVAFSPDGKTLAVASVQYGSGVQFVLWDMTAGKPLGPPRRVREPILALGFADDGKTLLTGSSAGTTFWPLADPLPGSADDIAQRMQALTGKEMDDRGVIRLLDAETWQERRQRLAAGPP